MISFQDKNVEHVILGYEEPFKSTLLSIRELIYKTAEKLDGVGELSESLKWGEPTFSTLQTKSGTPIRIDKSDDKIGVFVNCSTTLIAQFRELFSEELTFSKNRAILLNPGEPLPIKELQFFIEAALLYHKDKIGKNGL